MRRPTVNRELRRKPLNTRNLDPKLDYPADSEVPTEIENSQESCDEQLKTKN